MRSRRKPTRAKQLGVTDEAVRCPRCGGYDPLSKDVPKDTYRCTPITCDAWTFVARLTKKGMKPIRPDGRADLHVVKDDAAQ